jgi:hypothetical protein
LDVPSGSRAAERAVFACVWGTAKDLTQRTQK